MAAPLQDLLTDDDAIRKVREYLILKGKGVPVPKAVVNGKVLKILSSKLAKNNDLNPFVLRCLEEFSSNFEDDSPWLENFEEVSQLVLSSLCLTIADTTQSTALSRLCWVIMNLGERGEPLSSTLFNLCADKILRKVALKFMNESFLDTMLATVCTLCRASEPSNIVIKYGYLTEYMRILAEKVHNWPCEAQASVYAILSKSLRTEDEAKKRATVWFEKQPSLRDVFIESYSKHFSEGCGQFLNELHELANPTQDAALGQTNWIESSSSSNASLYIKTSSGVDIKWKNSKLIKPSTSNSTKPLATVGCRKKSKDYFEDLNHIHRSFGAIDKKRRPIKRLYTNCSSAADQQYAPLRVRRFSLKGTDNKSCKFDKSVISYQRPTIEAEADTSKVTKWLESQPEECDEDIYGPIAPSNETVTCCMETSSYNEGEFRDQTKPTNNIEEISLSAFVDRSKDVKALSSKFNTSYEVEGCKWPSFNKGRKSERTSLHNSMTTMSGEDDVMGWWHISEEDKNNTQQLQNYLSTLTMPRNEVDKLQQIPDYYVGDLHLNPYERRLKELEELMTPSSEKHSSNRKHGCHKNVLVSKSKRSKVFYDPLI